MWRRMKRPGTDAGEDFGDTLSPAGTEDPEELDRETGKRQPITAIVFARFSALTGERLRYPNR